MKNLKIVYDQLSQKQKHELLLDLYIGQKQSFSDIAKIYSTYSNKIRRDAISFNINIRTKSEAQKNALSTGKHKHPTKGKERSQDIKNKIGHGVMNSWDSLSEADMEDRKKKSKDNWDKLSIDDKQNMQKAASNAVRVSSKIGSKLEQYIFQRLIQDNIHAEFHKEQTLLNTKLQIDIFLPKISVAIEIDGPSHFLPVWGEDSLKKNISYDQKKEGLIIGKGWHLIRVKQLKDFSNARSDDLYNKVKDCIIILSNKSTVGSQKFLIEE